MARFEIARSTEIAAPRERVHALIDDFHEWTRWSPWEDVDPELRRTYSGPERGVGARYAWSGNRRAGAGTMAIAASSPAQVLVDLSFTKPVKARNDLAFDLAESDRGTHVTWTMRGENRGVAAIVWRIFPMERELGKQFEQGLAQLRAAAESA